MVRAEEHQMRVQGRSAAATAAVSSVLMPNTQNRALRVSGGRFISAVAVGSGFGGFNFSSFFLDVIR